MSKSDDGRYVLFKSNLDILPGWDPNRIDLYRGDLRTGTTIRLAEDIGASEFVALSGDGRRAAYARRDQNGTRATIVHDVDQGVTVAATPYGYLNGRALSADGRRLV